MNYTVKNLRKAGLKIKCLHERIITIYERPKGLKRILKPIYQIKLDKEQDLLQANGGNTTVIASMNDGKEFTVSTECSKNDNFDKKRAIRICLGRLEKLFIKEGINPFTNPDEIPPENPLG
jgi:hypothetical protein